MARKGAKRVEIKDADDKRQITGNLINLIHKYIVTLSK